ncbi:hypothetical protein PVK06_009488 [Gossypium arboreum]|uniref:Uncharacterized protein n=1 Tax=Gossypium arboreum TaxID=29729 RepID=A0ABR0QMM4_GOSAR|nr:hypothetical protein PVK06_009488 [Gossypium arboreum]
MINSNGFLNVGWQREYTITLEDATLQLGLSMKGPDVNRLAVVLSKKDICEAFLRKVPNKFQGDRIGIK